MANEIKYNLSLSVNKGGVKTERQESNSIDMTGESITHSVQEISTDGEVLVEGDVLGTVGYVYIKNLDSTNYVTVGSHATSNHAIKLKAGEACLFRAAGSVYVQANTAACNVEYIVIED
jgi:hypothetical protein